MPVKTGKTAFMEMLPAGPLRYIFGNPGASELAAMSSREEYLDISNPDWPTVSACRTTPGTAGYRLYLPQAAGIAAPGSDP